MLKATKSKAQFFAYRLSTVLKSFKALYTLPQEKVDAFLDSFDIWDHDWKDKESLVKDWGENYYERAQKKLIDYYSVLNLLCAVGQVEKMYIPPAIDLSKSVIKNQELFEKKLATELGIKKTDRVLDFGCGRGRVAAHMAKISGAHVTGINIDSVQLDYARRYAAAKSLENTYLQKDLNDLPFDFPDNHFDAIYEIQAFTYSKDRKKLIKELYRILKPGGKLAFIDWVSLENYDPNNQHHVDLMRRTKALIAAIGTPTVQDFVDDMEDAGFKILANYNPSIDGLQAPLIEKADKFFNKTTKLIHGLVKIKVLPKHFTPLFDRFIQDGKAFVEADRKRLVTTCHYFAASKQ